MDDFLNQARSATLVMILTLVPASGLFAQGHKGQHGAGQQQGYAKAKQPAPHKAAAPAAKTTTPQPTIKTNSRTANHQPTKSNEELLSTLHSTKSLLTQANHDPLGHKTRALQEVGNAIKLLSTQTNGSRTGQTATTPRKFPSIGQTSPARSEVYLTEAQKQLRSVESEMAGEGVHAHQVTQARTSVQNAIRELNLALVDR